MANHQVVFPGAKVGPDAIKKVCVHRPFRNIGLHRPTRAIDLVDIHGLIPVIFRQNHPKALPHTSFTVHSVCIPVIPVCVSDVFYGVLASVLTSVWLFRIVQNYLG